MSEVLHSALQGFFVSLADFVARVLRHVDTVPDAASFLSTLSVWDTVHDGLRVRVAEVGRDVVVEHSLGLLPGRRGADEFLVEFVHLADWHPSVCSLVDDGIALNDEVPDERPCRVLVAVPLLTVVLSRVGSGEVTLLAETLVALDGPREDSRDLVLFDPGLEAEVSIHVLVVGVLREAVGELDEEPSGVERSLGILHRRDAVRGEDHLGRVLHLSRRFMLRLDADIVLPGQLLEHRCLLDFPTVDIGVDVHRHRSKTLETKLVSHVPEVVVTDVIVAEHLGDDSLEDTLAVVTTAEEHQGLLVRVVSRVETQPHVLLEDWASGGFNAGSEVVLPLFTLDVHTLPGDGELHDRAVVGLELANDLTLHQIE